MLRDSVVEGASPIGQRSSKQAPTPPSSSARLPPAALRQVVGVREADARAAGATRWPDSKQAVSLLGGNAGAVVSHAEHETCALLAQGEADGFAARREGNRVQEQVDEDLLNDDRIGQQHVRNVVFDLYLHTASVRDRADAADGVAHQADCAA